ncbi:hypothetical protein T484DRAFT_1799604 [Baffinella frigidus]|nr:hypothetical protein T484DRAFT_1799604 [Cryptophyta sp. CCMP2293]
MCGKKHNLGSFDTAPEAARSRDSLFFNFPDKAAALVSPDGALHPLPDDANKNTKKFYAAP